MKLTITHQEQFSRGELLLRTFLGWLYIGIPHMIPLFFVLIWSGVLSFVTFWVVLFTGRFPEGIFSFQLKVQNWYLRLTASLQNLVDGYPAFGLNGTSEKATLELERPEKVSRVLVLVRAIFGIIYVIIPHGFALGFRGIGTGVLAFLAFWAVLFTGRYPENWHAFNVGTIRWNTRVNLYLGFYTDEYPKFSGLE